MLVSAAHPQSGAPLPDSGIALSFPHHPQAITSGKPERCFTWLGPWAHGPIPRSCPGVSSAPLSSPGLLGTSQPCVNTFEDHGKGRGEWEWRENGGNGLRLCWRNSFPVFFPRIPSVWPALLLRMGEGPGGWVRTSFLHLSPRKSDLQAEPTLGEVPSAVTDLTINL